MLGDQVGQQDRLFYEFNLEDLVGVMTVVSLVMTSPSIKIMTFISAPKAKPSRPPARSTMGRRSCTGHRSAIATAAPRRRFPTLTRRQGSSYRDP